MTRSDDFTLSALLLQPCVVTTTGAEWREAEEAGWDMSLVKDALSHSVQERLLQHDRTLTQALEMRAAFREQYGFSSNTH